MSQHGFIFVTFLHEKKRRWVLIWNHKVYSVIKQIYVYIYMKLHINVPLSTSSTANYTHLLHHRPVIPPPLLWRRGQKVLEVWSRFHLNSGSKSKTQGFEQNIVYKKKTGFPPPNRIIISRSRCSSLGGKFWKSHGFTHQVSGFTFPTNCPHSILPILAVFFVKFPAKRLWGKGCFFQNVFRFRLRGEHPIGI